MSDKPAILKDQEFTVEEGFLYRASRTGAIWMNKLFFSSAVLLAVWLVFGYATGIQDCTTTPNVVEQNGSLIDDGEKDTCTVLLSVTAKYLGAMTIISFLLSLAFGVLGLVVGKNIIEMTRTSEEVGSEEHAGESVPDAEPRDEP